MALMQTLRLNDTGAGIDTGVWNISTGVSSNYIGGRFSIGDSLVFVNATSIAQHDLTASYAFIETTSVRTVQPSTYTVYPLRMNLDGNNYIYWAINDEKIKAYKVVAGVSTLLAQATYDRTLHKGFRIRESGGTVYWDYSVDHSTWVNFASNTVAGLFAVTALYLQIGGFVTIIDTPDQVFFDCLNVSYPNYSLISDNFNDNSLDTSMWSTYESGGITVTETNQQIELTYPASASPFNNSWLSSWIFENLPTRVHQFNGGTAKAEVIQVPDQTKDVAVTFVVQNPYNFDYARWRLQLGTLYAEILSVTGLITAATLTYNASTHRWWRIREIAGTLYFDTSTNGIAWINRGTSTYDFSLAAADYSYYAFSNSSGSTITNAGKFILDNANTYPSPIINLTGDAAITSAPHVTYYPEINITGDASIAAIGTSLADQRQIDKSYLYKIYDSDNNYLGLWNDVISDLNFDHELNTPGSSIQVELARNSDSRVVDLEELFTTSGENITTQDSNNLIVGAESRNSVGPGSNVDVNYYVQIFVFYGEITELSTSSGEIITTEADEPIQVNYGAVNGLRKFHGKIVRYVSRYGGQETVQVSIDSLGRELDNDVLEDGTNTSVEYAGYDPSNIVKDALDKFTAGGGIVDYDTSSVATTGTNVTYTFRVNTILEVIQKCLELAPYDWYWYVGLGDDILYFQDKPTTVSHTFILGKHIQELNLEYSIENLVNLVYFTGGETAGVNLFKKYSDATSISNYGQGLQRISDHRVTIDANAALIAEAEIDRNSIPRYRTSITILDTVFDIEDIRLGQLIAFRNFDNYIDELELQIVGLRYEPDRVTLQLDSLLPSVNKCIEDLRRNLVELDNVETPDAPS